MYICIYIYRPVAKGAGSTAEFSVRVPEIDQVFVIVGVGVRGKMGLRGGVTEEGMARSVILLMLMMIGYGRR